MHTIPGIVPSILIEESQIRPATVMMVKQILRPTVLDKGEEQLGFLLGG